MENNIFLPHSNNKNTVDILTESNQIMLGLIAALIKLYYLLYIYIYNWICKNSPWKCLWERERPALETIRNIFRSCVWSWALETHSPWRRPGRTPPGRCSRAFPVRCGSAVGPGWQPNHTARSRQSAKKTMRERWSKLQSVQWRTKNIKM